MSSRQPQGTVWKAVILAAASLVVLLVISSCGSSGDSSTPSDAAAGGGAGPGNPGQLTAQVRSCLKQQGVNLPSAPNGQTGGSPPGGVPNVSGQPPSFPGGGQGPAGGGAKLRQAFQKCGVQAPQGGPGQGGPPPANSAAFRDSVNKYVSCVEKNGYDLPKPNLSGNGPVFESSQVNQNDPDFKAASQKCSQVLRPSGPGQPQ